MERLNMHLLRDLVYRLRKGESERRIARDLGIARGSVHKYRVLAEDHGFLNPDLPLPEESDLRAVLGPVPQPPRQSSTVEPYAEIIEQLLALGCEMTAIHIRLCEDHGYTGSYSSVRRFVHSLRPQEPRVVVRVNTAPGEEAQVDFGSVGKLFDPQSKRLRTAYAFVATLCYSRHQYAELVFDQKVPTWIALHRRAFQRWGGVPQRLVPDNLKAAVSKALIYEPVLGEAYRRMAQHYGFLISPTRPHTPQHKGKVESGIHYLQRNFMAGQEFADIRQANQRLALWVRERAGAREHGTTHQAPLKLFLERERAVLLPLPPQPFTLCEMRPVKVHRDCHVAIQGSTYSVPYRYVGQTLEAHIGEGIVQIFYQQDLVATHKRAHAKGERHTRYEHYPPEKAAYLRKNPDYCRRAAQRVGPATFKVVDGLLAERPLDQLRSAQGILTLKETVGASRLEAACRRALYYGDGRYRRIKQILNAALDQQPLPQDHPVSPARVHTYARSTKEFFAIDRENAR